MARGWVVGVLAIAATFTVAIAIVLWLQDDDGGGSPDAADPSPSSTTSGGSPTTGSTSDPVSGPPVIGTSVVELDHFRSPDRQHRLRHDQRPGAVRDRVVRLRAAAGATLVRARLGCDPAGDDRRWHCPDRRRLQGDTALGAEDELAYGTASVIGDFACLSQESGMTCWNQITRHGFSVARADYAVF